MGLEMLENGRLRGFGSWLIIKEKFGKQDNLPNEPKISEIWIYGKPLQIFLNCKHLLLQPNVLQI